MSADQEAPRRPLNPYWVMAVAAVLPGIGQVLNYQPRRALMFLFFIVIAGWVSFHLTTPDHSFVGRYAGGFFIYAVSVLDAYKWARVRWVMYQYPREGQSPGS